MFHRLCKQPQKPSEIVDGQSTDPHKVQTVLFFNYLNFEALKTGWFFFFLVLFRSRSHFNCNFLFPSSGYGHENSTMSEWEMIFCIITCSFILGSPGPSRSWWCVNDQLMYVKNKMFWVFFWKHVCNLFLLSERPNSNSFKYFLQWKSVPSTEWVILWVSAASDKR